MPARRWTVSLVALSLLIGLALSALPSPAAAQAVDEIIKRGKVVIGVNTTTPIFGLIGTDGQPEGYDPDVARLVGKYLGVQVEFVPVTGANRLPYLLTSRVDMVIALFGITPERAQQIWFSIPYATEAAVLVAPASRAVKTVDDLGGLRVGVPRGAMQDLILTPQAAAKKINLMRFDDEATALQAMVSGQIDVRGHGPAGQSHAEPQRPRQELRGQARTPSAALRHRRPPRPDRAAAVAEHLRLHHQEQRRAGCHQP